MRVAWIFAAVTATANLLDLVEHSLAEPYDHRRSGAKGLEHQ